MRSNWSDSTKSFKLKPNSIFKAVAVHNETKCLSRDASVHVYWSCLNAKDPTEQKISRFSVIETVCWDDVYANTVGWQLHKLAICLKVCFKSKPGFHSTVSKWLWPSAYSVKFVSSVWHTVGIDNNLLKTANMFCLHLLIGILILSLLFEPIKADEA